MTAEPAVRSLSERLADYWSTARVEDFPAPVVAMAKRVLLDTLLVGVRGGTTEDAGAVREALRLLGTQQEGASAVWGIEGHLTPDAAALVNGTAAHALELDDFAGCGHSGAVVVPAVAAIADAIGADGASVLRAVVAGYDVAARVTEGAGGYRPHNERGWHSTGTCGTFGAAAGAAAILGLDAARFCSALGIAGSYAAGTWAYLADGAMTKRLHAGKAASSGVMAAYLAKAGLTGPRFVLDADWAGFYETYGGTDATPQATIDGLGKEFRILRSGIKLYPCCRGLHSMIEALLSVLDDGVATEAMERIVVHGAERTVRQFGNREIHTVLDGQFSMPYALAVVADSRRATLDQFLPPRSRDTKIARLMRQVDVLADRQLGPYEEPELEVRLKSGETIMRHVPVAKGAAANPLSDGELRAKHEDVGLPVLGREKFSRLVKYVADIERLDDFRKISRLLQP
jgi:2-methylcitrate dehydratase PrpD